MSVITQNMNDSTVYSYPEVRKSPPYCLQRLIENVNVYSALLPPAFIPKNDSSEAYYTHLHDVRRTLCDSCLEECFQGGIKAVADIDAAMNYISV